MILDCWICRAPALPGPHQIQNAGMVIAALRHLGLRPEVCEAALRNATWPARMQRLATGPLVDAAKGADLWLDGGHNPAAAIAIAETLAEHPDRETYLITGNAQDQGRERIFQTARQLCAACLCGIDRKRGRDVERPRDRRCSYRGGGCLRHLCHQSKPPSRRSSKTRHMPAF